MNRIILLLISLLFFHTSSYAQEYLEMIDAGTYPVQEVIDTAEAYFEGKDLGKGSGYTQFKRWEYRALQLMREDGYLATITEEIDELNRYNAYLNETAQTRQVLNDNWQELGPSYWNATTSWSPGVGRITGISVDTNDANHIIVGANTGGVWKTIDGGQTWAPLGDQFTNLDVYSVTIDPSNSDVYYFGSTSGIIFKSVDAGGTWNQLADMSNSLINKIKIHPANSDIIFAASQNAGIYRSIDAGATWQVAANDGNAYDIEFHPTNNLIVYASGSSFHKSTDGGMNFTIISGFDNGPKMIGVSEASPNVVYVLEADDGGFGGFYRSTNSGSNFLEIDHGTTNYLAYEVIDEGGNAPRDMDIAVSPINANEVHIAGIHTWISLDGGVSFNQSSHWVPDTANMLDIGYCHADVDILEYAAGSLFVGSDGGIFKADDSANVTATYFEDITAGLGIRQFYKIGVSQEQDVTITGGSQDNGSSLYRDATGWIDWIGADGMEGFVDKEDSDIVYGMIQLGYMYRTEDAGVTLNYIGLASGEEGRWVSPFEQDPVEPNTIYAGFDAIYKSDDKGQTWTPISQTYPTLFDNLKIAPSNNQIMYGSRIAAMVKTTDGGATNWTAIPSPGGRVNSIAVHPTNPNKVAVAVGSANKVFVSNDGGATWENYLKNLPNFSAKAVIWDDNGVDGLYLGMNYGIYYIDNTLTDWQPYNNNLPNVDVRELDINHETDMLYAATYGRGLWVSPLSDDILGTSTNALEASMQLVPNPAIDAIEIVLGQAVTADIRIFDISGKLIYYTPDVPVSNRHVLHISTLEAGVYFIRINSEAGTATKKFIKE